jgi:phage I-like protein
MGNKGKDGNDPETVTLTAKEVEVSTKLGLSVEDMLKQKQKEAAKAKGA